MPVGRGSRLGPYEVTALIGEGGMGKVWRAHHAALKRDDALKVLPDAFASDLIGSLGSSERRRSSPRSIIRTSLTCTALNRRTVFKRS